MPWVVPVLSAIGGGSAVAGGALVASTAVGAAGVVSQNKASKRATKAQVLSGDQAIAEQRSQFDKMQSVLAPFVEGGGESFTGLLDIMGANGPEAEQAHIDQIRNSPEFTSLVQAGEEGILQNASATGGLRGGNTQDALSKFRPQVLSGLIKERFNRFLAGSQIGQSSAAQVGSGALNTGQGVSNTIINQGEAVGQGAIAKGNQNSQFLGGVSKLLATQFGGQRPIPEMNVTF